MRNFTERLRAAWRADTSFDHSWSEDNPALGHCAVTALAVQDEFGGDLLRAEIPGGSHYWNRLPDGSEVDLTAGQFERPIDRVNVETRERSYLLSNHDTATRYCVLKARMEGA